MRELSSGKRLSDVLRWVKFSSIAWTEGNRGSSTAAIRSRHPARRSKQQFVTRRSTTTPSAPSSRPNRLIYERRDDPSLYIDVDIDETGRFVWFETNKGTSNKNELFVKDLGVPLAPKLDAPVRALYPGHTAAYQPLGVVAGLLYLQTDLDAPTKKIVAVPLDRPDAGNWKTIDASRAINPHRRWGTTGSRTLSAWRTLDGTASDDSPDSRAIIRPVRSAGIFVHVTAQPSTVYPSSTRIGNRRSSGFDPRCRACWGGSRNSVFIAVSGI